MKLFESSWREKYTVYERYFDTVLGKSVKAEVKTKAEWFEPSSTGIYSYILDDSVKLEKKQGNAKDGREQYGFLDPIYRNIRDEYWNNTGYNSEPRVFYLDIETRVGTVEGSIGFPVPEKALEPICLMQFFDSKTKVLFVLGLRPWVHQKDYKFDSEVKYIQCSDEINLLETFLKIFKALDPLIIHAWFGSGFDFPYIYNRIKLLGLNPGELSNHGKVHYSECEFKGQKEFKFSADGHFWVDLMDVYKKFTFEPRPGYSLDVIAEIELKQNKISHTEYARWDDFYTGNYIIPDNPTIEQKESKIYQAALKGDWDEVRELSFSEFVYYGCVDVFLIKQIDDKGNFSTIMTMIAEKMGVQIGDSTGTVKPWSQYLANKSMLNHQVQPPQKDHPQPNVVGGFVRESNIGKHQWVLSTDVNSMYPLLGMAGFNMSPETFVPKHKLPNQLRDIVLQYFSDQDEARVLALPKEVKEKTTELLQEYNLALGINGAVFTKEKTGIIPELVLELYSTRKAAKRTMFSYEKQKVLIQEILKTK